MGYTFVGLDVRAIEKRENAKTEGEFKVPKKSAISVTSSLDEEDKSDVSGLDYGTQNTRPDHSSRRYRDKSSRSETAQGIIFLMNMWFPALDFDPSL